MFALALLSDRLQVAGLDQCLDVLDAGVPRQRARLLATQFEADVLLRIVLRGHRHAAIARNLADAVVDHRGRREPDVDDIAAL